MLQVDIALGEKNVYSNLTHDLPMWNRYLFTQTPVKLPKPKPKFIELEKHKNHYYLKSKPICWSLNIWNSKIAHRNMHSFSVLFSSTSPISTLFASPRLYQLHSNSDIFNIVLNQHWKDNSPTVSVLEGIIKE